MKVSAHTWSVAAMVLALVWFVFAISELAGGVGDTFRHWWTALPVAVLALATTATIATSRRR